MLCDRLPKWFQEDPANNAINDEVDALEISTYLNALGQKVKQPIQVWATPIPGTPLTYKYNALLRASKIRPIWKLEFYDENDNLLSTFTYRKYDRTTLASETLEGPYSSDTFYVKVYYYYYYKWQNTYLRHRIPAEVGFPQSADATDDKYLTNSRLDNIAQRMGMFRRTYKTSIDAEDLPYTYPPYYGYDIEQDYYLEKRLLSRYTTKNESNETQTIDDLLTLSIKDLDVCIVEVGCLSNTNHEIYLEMKGINDVTIEEFYSETTIEDLVDSINSDSEIVTATFIAEGTLTSAFYQLENQGVQTTYGLMKAEIHQYLGCIPDLVNITEYLLKWNIDKWNSGKFWGGDIYHPGTFYLNIPYYEIPRNFNLLTQDELQTIADQCKMFGTRVLPPQYCVDASVEVGYRLSVGHPYYFIDKYVNIPPMRVVVTDSLREVCLKPSVSVLIEVVEPLKYLTSNGCLVYPDIIPDEDFIVVTEDGEFVWADSGTERDVQAITEDGNEIIPAMVQTIPTVAYEDSEVEALNNGIDVVIIYDGGD